MKIYGKNVFNEISNKKIIHKIYLSYNFKDLSIFNEIKKNNISYEFVDSKTLDKMASNHQGIVMIVDDYKYSKVESFYDKQIVVMLDHLEDPHNLGAIIRTCEAANIDSIIIPNKRCATVNSTVYKTSCGALFNVNIALVSNLTQTINKFKENNFFVYGADMDGKNYKDINYSDKVLLIIGNEQKGISRLVRENCDEIISVPMNGKINSLNASVAAAILIYSIVNR